MSRFHEAVGQLACILESENAALQSMNLAASNALLAAKHEALARFEAERSNAPSPTACDPGLKILATRLHYAANDNKRLLERAMIAQRHVMALMARAMNEAVAPGCYGSKGLVVCPRPGGAFALRSSA